MSCGATLRLRFGGTINISAIARDTSPSSNHVMTLFLPGYTTNRRLILYSIHGQAKTLEDTERFARNCLPVTQDENDKSPKSYRVVYAVHELINPKPNADNSNAETRLIGLINT